MKFLFVPESHMTVHRHNTAQIRVFFGDNTEDIVTCVSLKIVHHNNRIFYGFNEPSLFPTQSRGSLVVITLGKQDDGTFYPLDKTTSYTFSTNKNTDILIFSYFESDQILETTQDTDCKMEIDQITIPSQLDKKYRNITDRQCSWFCAEIIGCSEKFVALYDQRNKKGIHDLYTKCLETATSHKKNSINQKEIETLFHPNIQKYIEQCTNVRHKYYKLLLNENINSDPAEYTDMLDSMYGNYYAVENYKHNLESITVNELIESLDNMTAGQMIAFNRHGESFVILKYKKQYICFDSHVHVIKSMADSNQVFGYVNDIKTENLVTVMIPNILYQSDKMEM